MRFIPILLVLASLLLISGCNKESSLEVRIKEVSWKDEQTRGGGTAFKTTIVIADERKLTFDGIHDFKVGHTYKIKVRENDAALIKFEPVAGKTKEEPQTFKPITNTTSDKIVFKVVVDKSGNILASEEVGPEVKTAQETKK